MTTSLTQLAALVPLDPTTLVLLLFALIPARWTPRVLRPALRRPWWLRWPTLLLAGVSMALPVLPWPVIALLNAYLFLEAFAVATAPGRPWRRWGALLAVAGFWSLQTFRTFWQTFFEPDGRAHFWFVDFFNKLYLATIDPLLLPLGGAELRGVVLGYLAEPVAFFSNHLLALHLMASLGAALLLTQVLVGRLATEDAPALETPRASTARLPAGLALLAALPPLLHTLAPQSAALTALREVGAALLVLQGLGLGLALSAGRPAGRAALLTLVLAMCLHAEVAWVVGAMGLGDSLFGLTRRWLGDEAREIALSREASAGVRLVRRGFGPGVLLLTAVPLLTFPMVPLSHMIPFAPPKFPDTPVGQPDDPNLVPVGPHSQSPFVIERYEAPNSPGVMPDTGRSPREAMLACEARGMRLCPSRSWHAACSNSGRSFYSVPSYPYQADALERLRRTCNLRDTSRPAALHPSGAMPRCKTAKGLLDMTGNAYEWVWLDRDGGFWGLAGSYYGYSDAQTPACGFRVLVHEAQLGIINRDAIGYRCCRQMAVQ